MAAVLQRDMIIKQIEKEALPLATLDFPVTV